MKILLVSPFPPQADGLAAYSAGLQRQYESLGHEVRGLTGATCPAGIVPLGRLTLRPGHLVDTYRAVRLWRPDCVHVQHAVATYGFALLTVWLLAAMFRVIRIPVLVTHHEVTRDIRRLRALGRYYYSFTSRIASAVHVHTAEASEALEDLGVSRARILIHPHPIFPLSRDEPGAAALRTKHALQGKTVLLQFGFLQIDKGLMESVMACERLVRRRPPMRSKIVLVIAGAVRRRPKGFARFQNADQAYVGRVRSYVREHQLEDLVVFTGRVPEDEVAGWLTLADWILLPYKEIEQSGVANVAISAGVPTLATPISGLAALFQQLPVIDDVRPEPFSRLIEECVTSPHLCDRYAEVYGRLKAASQPSKLLEHAMHPKGTADAWTR